MSERIYKRNNICLFSGDIKAKSKSIMKNKEIVVKINKINKKLEIFYCYGENKHKQVKSCFVDLKEVLNKFKGLDLTCESEKELNSTEYASFAEYILNTIFNKDNKANLNEPQSEELWLSLSLEFELAANKLFNEHPIYYFIAGYILHLSLESLLKACALYNKDEFPNSHKLLELIEFANLKLPKKIEELIEAIDEHHSLRYSSPKNCVGTYDLKKFNIIRCNILKVMPENFCKKYINEARLPIFSNIEKLINTGLKKKETKQTILHLVST